VRLVDTDILKPDTGYLTVIERPSVSSAKHTPDHHSPSGSHSTDEQSGLSGAEVEAAIAYREQMLKERRKSEAASSAPKMSKRELKAKKSTLGNGNDKLRALSIDPLAPSSAFDETLKSRLRRERDARRQQTSDVDEDGEAGDDEAETANQGDDRVLARDWAAPIGKRIAVPVRIEPKVYFAAERTFLKWLNIAVFIGSIATTLLNFIPPEDSRGLISAALFTFAALLAIAYSAGIFIYRAYRLRARSAEGLYYDKYGPTALCFAIFAALATNIGLRASEMMTDGGV